ncbi:MAG: DUF4126 domain-containing protein [Anaerolineales bacterium]
MEVLTGVFSAFGLSASAGLNAYIPLLVVALTARYTDLIKLNPPWDALTNGWIIGLLMVLLLIEIFADKIPAVNHINDAIQTFVRPVAGAIVFAAGAQVFSDLHPVIALAAGVLVAGSVHAAKSIAVRPIVTATTGGTGNLAVSTMEDVTATVTSIIAIVIPVLLLLIAGLVGVWIIYKVWSKNKRQMGSV